MRAVVLWFLVGCTPTEETDRPDDSDSPGPTVSVRVATWNVQGLGRPGSAGFEAAKRVLARIDADVLSLNEIGESEGPALGQLASALGLDAVWFPPDNPFGPERNAILSRRPAVVESLSPGALSGDRNANDVTRLPVRAVVPLDEVGRELTVVGQHWKSGFDLADRFRRAVDATRTAQAATGDVVVMLGDVNAEPGDMPEDPPIWKYAPEGMPNDYRLGQDIRATLSAGGLPNDAFAPGLDAGLALVPARQVDGREVTRPVSGRRIDWIFVSAGLEGSPSEVYDCTDEGKGGLPKRGDPPERADCETASDHLPVFVDLSIGASGE